MSIEYNINSFKNKLSSRQCRLIAVSKRKSIEEILEAYHAGQRDFGENKVQELITKVPNLPADIHWHMIGHLQRNKVKYIAPFVSLIHSVDSDRLLLEINKQAERNERVIRCLLQVHIAEEESKFGFSADEIKALMGSEEIRNLHFIKICGLMGMATNTDNYDQVKKEFKGLKALFEQLKALNLPKCVEVHELSMGMTSDYEVAIEQGSTMIRIGSAIFGPRE